MLAYSADAPTRTAVPPKRHTRLPTRRTDVGADSELVARFTPQQVNRAANHHTLKLTPHTAKSYLKMLTRTRTGIARINNAIATIQNVIAVNKTET